MSADIILTALLVIGFPAYVIWLNQSSKVDQAAPLNKKSMGRTLWIAYSFVMALSAIWISAHRPLSELGLEWPLSRASIILLIVSVVLLGSFALWARLARSQPSQSEILDRMLPRSTSETIRYAFKMLSLGAIWEVLYRGYLIWSLKRYFGLWPAVVIAALSYGLAHGIKNRKQTVGSLVSAIVFASAYGISHSLWWLVLIHCALPFMLFAAKRKTQTEAEALQEKA